jgi:hypothetical protein
MNFDITIQNPEKENFDGISAEFLISPESEHFEYKKEEIVGNLPPNGEKIISFSIKSDFRAEPGDYRLSGALKEGRYGEKREFQIPLRVKVREPEFRIVSLKVNDKSTLYTWGNGNGVLEEEEIAGLSITIENDSDGASLSTIFSLLTAHPDIEIIKGEIDGGDIMPREKREIEFILSLASGYSGPDVLPISLMIKRKYGEEIIPLNLSCKKPFPLKLVLIAGGIFVFVPVFIFLIW